MKIFKIEKIVANFLLLPAICFCTYAMADDIYWLGRSDSGGGVGMSSYKNLDNWSSDKEGTEVLTELPDFTDGSVDIKISDYQSTDEEGNVVDGDWTGTIHITWGPGSAGSTALSLNSITNDRTSTSKPTNFWTWRGTEGAPYDTNIQTSVSIIPWYGANSIEVNEDITQNSSTMDLIISRAYTKSAVVNSSMDIFVSGNINVLNGTLQLGGTYTASDYDDKITKLQVDNESNISSGTTLSINAGAAWKLYSGGGIMFGENAEVYLGTVNNYGTLKSTLTGGTFHVDTLNNVGSSTVATYVNISALRSNLEDIILDDQGAVYENPDAVVGASSYTITNLNIAGNNQTTLTTSGRADNSILIDNYTASLVEIDESTNKNLSYSTTINASSKIDDLSNGNIEIKNILINQLGNTYLTASSGTLSLGNITILLNQVATDDDTGLSNYIYLSNGQSISGDVNLILDSTVDSSDINNVKKIVAIRGQKEGGEVTIGGDLNITARKTSIDFTKATINGVIRMSDTAVVDGIPYTNNVGSRIDLTGWQSLARDLDLTVGGIETSFASEATNSTNGLVILAAGSEWSTGGPVSCGVVTLTIDVLSGKTCSAIASLQDGYNAANPELNGGYLNVIKNGDGKQIIRGTTDGVVALTYNAYGTVFQSSKTGTSFYHGTTTVNAGTLLLSADGGSTGSRGIGDIILNGGAIGAIGLIGEDNNDIGIIKTTGMTWNSAGKILVDIIGDDCDLINITGELSKAEESISNTYTIEFILSGSINENTDYKIVNFSSTTFSETELFEGICSGYEATIALRDDGLYVNFAAIPELSTMASIFGLMALGFVTYRRRK